MILFSVFSELLSSNPDFCVSSLSSNFRFLEMAEWCNLGKTSCCFLHTRHCLVAHRNLCCPVFGFKLSAQGPYFHTPGIFVDVQCGKIEWD